MNQHRTSMPDKDKWRGRLRTRRQALDLTEVARSSARLCEALMGAPVFDGITALAGYMALGNEIDCFSFLEACLHRGIELYLPRVIDGTRMEFARCQDLQDLQVGPFGILESRGPARAADEIGYFLVPGVGFDRRGHRLGFGKGYYDRGLPPAGKGVAIGVAYEWQIINQVLPVESHDRRMDLLVTDEGWMHPGGDIQDAGV